MSGSYQAPNAFNYPANTFNNPPGFIPAQVPPDPYYISNTPFDNLINQFGVRLLWEKSHSCPCMWQGYPNQRGSPQPGCLTCSGLGWYWDAPVGPFQGMLTFSHATLGADEPGAIENDRLGQIINADPLLTLSYACQPLIWQEASEFDRFTQIDAYWRFNSTLFAEQKTELPYTYNITVSGANAVTAWDSATSSIFSVTGYSVSGNIITPSGLAYGQPYTVEFLASPQYMLIRNNGSFPHVRPFIGGSVPLPKRFRMQMADLWLRQQGSY